MSAGSQAPAWQRRFRAARVSLPTWAEEAPQRAVYASNATGVWQVHSWDLDGDRHVTLTGKPTGVRSGRPSPDGQLVAWFDDGHGDEVGRYVATPFAGGRASGLVDEAGTGWAQGISWRADRLAVGMAGRDGFRIGVRQGAAYRTVWSSVTPAQVGGLSRDGRLLAVVHAEHGDALHPSLRVLDTSDGRVAGDLHDGRGNTVVSAGWSPLPGDGRLAVLADRTGRTRPEVWQPAGGERVACRLDLPGEVGVADWWPDGRALLLTHEHLGRVELQRYDLDRHSARRLDLPPGTVAAARVRDDGTLWYAFTSAARPPQARARDAAGDDGVLLPPPGPEAPAGVPYTSLHYDNGVGDRIHAFLATPPGDGPFPLVVEVHGGPHAQVSDSFSPVAQAWVDHGFAVLQPNYRGSTGYGKAFQDTLVGDPGRPELEDLRAGRDHLVAAGVADPRRTVLAGGSWGGYLTLLGLGTQPESWAAGVAIVPVADYPTAFADESPALQEFDRSLFGGTPDELPDLYVERSPLTYVDAVRAPVLIITGANDTRCPRRQVDNYVEALAARGKPHRYDVFDAGHGSLAVEETIRQQALALDFLAEHLGTAPAQR